MILYLSHRTY